MAKLLRFLKLWPFQDFKINRIDQGMRWIRLQLWWDDELREEKLARIYLDDWITTTGNT